MSRVTADRATDEQAPDKVTFPDQSWRNLSARLTSTVGLMSGRPDVIARIAPGLSPGAPAMFVIPIAQVEVDPDLCLPENTDPDHVDPRTPSGRRAHPVLVGACAHEAGHAAYSLWLTPAGTGAAAASAAGLLEETRMEGRYVTGRPGDRAWLQRSAAALVAGCEPEHAEPVPVPWAAAKMAALLCARADAGVLDHDKVAPVEARVRQIVGDDTFEVLRSIWLEAHACADDDAAGMVALGARWCEAVGVAPDGPDPDGAVTGTGATRPGDESDADGAEDGEATASTPGTADDEDGEATASTPDAADSDGDSDGDTPGSGDEDLDAAVTQALTETADEAQDRISGAFAASHARKNKEVSEREQAARARSNAARTADQVTRGDLDNGTSNNRSRTRPPTSTERTAATRLGRALDQARYRAPAVDRVTTDTPPGKVRFSAAMQMDRQTALGLPTTAKPFRVKRFTPQAEPDPKVAVLCDVSGSMWEVTAAVASTGWVLAHAARRVHANVTTLMFGNGVAPLTEPGADPDQVQEFTALDGTELITEALDAADGMLGLTGGTGPRLVFVVSDAQFYGDGWDQLRRAQAKIRALTKDGVIVVWVPFGDYDPNGLPGAQVAIAGTPDKLGEVITKAILDAVRTAA